MERVDVVLYLFAPHRCKPADVALLKQLKGKASIVPILAKADSMTSDELAHFRVQVTNALIEAKVPVAHQPIAIITATRPAGREPLGREYPWGLAESESRDPEYMHSELDRCGALPAHRRAARDQAGHAGALRGLPRAYASAGPACGLRALLRALLSPSQLIVARCCCQSRARSSRAPSRRLPSRPRQSSSRSADFRSKLSGWSGGLLRAASPSWAQWLEAGGGDALEGAGGAAEEEVPPPPPKRRPP